MIAMQGLRGLAHPSASGAVVEHHAAGQSAPASFTALEWAVVALARGDGVASVRPLSSISVLLGWFFGAGVGQTLADPRLEALRRQSVLVWNGLVATPDEMSAFMNAGYEQSHLDLLRRSVERAAADHDPGQERLAASQIASLH